LPYHPDETLPLIHVADVAAVVERLVAAPQTAHTLYNTPADNWRCGELAAHLESLNPHIRVVLGEAQVTGTPEAVDGVRFTDEFGATILPVRVRLGQAVGHLQARG
jgi:hypothetical protein